MRKFFKRVFSTKFKVLPVYEKNKQTGYIVYEKCWASPLYMASELDTTTEDEVCSKTPAVFKTNEEAIGFIKAKVKVYTYETISAD